jgi:hypothetical protein
MRPTGPLHLGNYMGALQNWVRLQDSYTCFFTIVDWHSLTTDYADPSAIRENILEVACDWLAAGLDPARSTLFIQSLVKEHAELHLLLSMVTPVSWLERVPTYKEQQQQLSEKDLSTYGFLGYPLLQTADIIVYKADAVPVGEDPTGVAIDEVPPGLVVFEADGRVGFHDLADERQELAEIESATERLVYVIDFQWPCVHDIPLSGQQKTHYDKLLAVGGRNGLSGRST